MLAVVDVDVVPAIGCRCVFLLVLAVVDVVVVAAVGCRCVFFCCCCFLLFFLLLLLLLSVAAVVAVAPLARATFRLGRYCKSCPLALTACLLIPENTCRDSRCHHPGKHQEYFGGDSTVTLAAEDTEEEEEEEGQEGECLNITIYRHVLKSHFQLQ